MNIELTPELEEYRTQVRRFTQEKLEPLTKEIDETGAIPKKAWELMGQAGYLGMRLPEEYGGSSASLAAMCLVSEELSRSHRVFTALVDSTSGLTPSAFVRHGTPEQRAKFVRKLVTGEMRAAFALTEPGAGSDPASMTTSAKRVDGGWKINGRKHYISSGHLADVIMVMTVTDPVNRARGGVTAFLVEKGTPGFAVTRVDRTIGSDAWQLAELTFEDCFVPDSAVMGKVGEGFKIAMESLTDGRMAVASCCIGAADRLLELAVEHAKQRVTFGQPLSERQAIQWMLADSAVELATARALTYDTLRRIEEGKPIGSAASMCKLYASEMAGRVSDRVVQVFGGQGIIRGFPIERFYRDLRHYRIGEGSSEVHRMIISRELFK